MLFHAKNGTVKIGDTDMDYVAFGRGPSSLILIPGVGDGLKTVKGLALPFALMYGKYAKHYRIYAFSRKNRLEPRCTTREMARDQIAAMEKLGISGACILGVSQGGMIAQYLAIDAPVLVSKLALAVTLAKPNETIQTAVGGWIKMAEAGDYKSLLLDTAKRAYTETYFKKRRLAYSALGKLGRPKDFSRFLIQANACLTHDASRELNKIKCPTLVIGADSDNVVGGNSSAELAQKIEGSRLVVYEGLGHGAYEEAKDFYRQVMRFFDEER